MLAAGFLVAAPDGIVGGVQEQDLVIHLFLVQCRQRIVHILNRAQAPHIQDHRYPVELVFALQGKVNQAGHQPCRNIVDAEKADVLQCIDGHGFSRP